MRKAVAKVEVIEPPRPAPTYEVVLRLSEETAESLRQSVNFNVGGNYHVYQSLVDALCEIARVRGEHAKR